MDHQDVDAVLQQSVCSGQAICFVFARIVAVCGMGFRTLGQCTICFGSVFAGIVKVCGIDFRTLWRRAICFGFVFAGIGAVCGMDFSALRVQARQRTLPVEVGDATSVVPREHAEASGASGTAALVLKVAPQPLLRCLRAHPRPSLRRRPPRQRSAEAEARREALEPSHEGLASCSARGRHGGAARRA